MFFEPNALYHIYNRSNETVFYSRDNYLYFLGKVRSLIAPVSKILAWVLMPNHFHFLIMSTEYSCINVNEKHRPDLQQLSKNIGLLLSSYTQAINRHQKIRGKLFSHNTKAKLLLEDGYPVNNYYHLHENEVDYATSCFLYIHKNPVLAGLVEKMEDWEFSSFRDYAGLRKGKLVDKDLAFEFVEINQKRFYEQSQIYLEESVMNRLF